MAWYVRSSRRVSKGESGVVWRDERTAERTRAVLSHRWTSRCVSNGMDGDGVAGVKYDGVGKGRIDRASVIEDR